MIVSAVHARQVGAEPRDGPSDERIVSEPRNDLESETVRLLLIFRAVRQLLCRVPGFLGKQRCRYEIWCRKPRRH